MLLVASLPKRKKLKKKRFLRATLLVEGEKVGVVTANKWRGSGIVAPVLRKGSGRKAGASALPQWAPPIRKTLSRYRRFAHHERKKGRFGGGA